MPLILKKQTNISKVFIVFLVASTFIWLLINLSKEYETTLRYEVVYEKLAQNKVLQENPLKEIDLLVKANGFKLLAANFSSRKLSLLANKLRKKKGNNYYFLTKNQQINIQKQLKSGIKLQRILKDTVYLRLGSLKSKKIPVFADLDIQYQLGYDIAEEIKISPDSILISGPELQLNKINSIKTSQLKLEDVSKNIKQTLEVLLPVDMSTVKIDTNQVEVTVVVDKFTEGNFEVPVKIKNLPEGVKLNTFPKNVKVFYKIGLNNFNKVTANSFEIICDYKKSKSNELSYLLPKLKSKPKLVSSVRIVPEKIDFLIHK